MTSPAETLTSSPVIAAAPSPARNATAAATSAGRTSRPSGVRVEHLGAGRLGGDAAAAAWAAKTRSMRSPSTRAGGDEVDAHAVRPGLERERADQPDQRGLARRVGRAAPQRALAGHRADEHDRAGAGGRSCGAAPRGRTAPRRSGWSRSPAATAPAASPTAGRWARRCRSWRPARRSARTRGACGRPPRRSPPGRARRTRRPAPAAPRGRARPRRPSARRRPGRGWPPGRRRRAAPGRSPGRCPRPPPVDHGDVVARGCEAALHDTLLDRGNRRLSCGFICV